MKKLIDKEKESIKQLKRKYGKLFSELEYKYITEQEMEFKTYD